MISTAARIEFEAVVGAENAGSTEEIALPSSWTSRPELIVAPGSVVEISAIVVACEKENIAIISVGGANQLDTGGSPISDRPHIFLSTRRMNRVLDHQPDDLTITCESGVTVTQTEQTLRQHKQMLALDGPLPDRSTLGGMVAAATAGVRRVAYGTPRDALIGMKAVITGGVAIKGGGKVVKNVAGYDVCKLFTGSWGSVGVLTELTFKVRPVPEVQRQFAWRTADAASAAAAGFKLHLAALSPTMILATTDHHGHPAIIVGVEGTAQRAEWQAAEFSRRAAGEGINASAVDLSQADGAALNNWPYDMARNSNAAARIACLPTELEEVVRRLSALHGSHILADCTTGTLHCIFDSADCVTLAAVQSALPANANCVWTRLAVEGDCITTVQRWGKAREDRLLQANMKSALDPNGTFSPGRFPGAGR